MSGHSFNLAPFSSGYLLVRLGFIHEGIPEISGRRKIPPDCAVGCPAWQVKMTTGFAVCARSPGPAKWMLPDNGSAGFVIDVKFASSIGNFFPQARWLLDHLQMMKLITPSGSPASLKSCIEYCIDRYTCPPIDPGASLREKAPGTLEDDGE